MTPAVLRIDQEMATAISAIRDGSAQPKQEEFLVGCGVLEVLDSGPQFVGPVASALQIIWDADATVEVARSSKQAAEWVGSLAITDDETAWVTASLEGIELIVSERKQGLADLAAQLIEALVPASSVALWIVRKGQLPEEWLVRQQRDTYTLVRSSAPAQAEVDGLEELAEALGALAEAR